MNAYPDDQDATTPEANQEQPKMSLADEILAMKAARDAQKSAASSEKPVTLSPSISTPVAESVEGPADLPTEREMTADSPEASSLRSEAEPNLAPVIAEAHLNEVKPEADYSKIADEPVSNAPVKPNEVEIEAVFSEESQSASDISSTSETEPIPVPAAVADETGQADYSSDAHEDSVPEIEEASYGSLTKEQLAAELRKHLSSPDALANGRKITELYRLFYQHTDREKAEAMQRYLETGGDTDAFSYQSKPDDAAIEKLMQQFRESRSKQARQQEETKQRNLEKKRALMEELRKLVEATETKDSANAIKRIQAEWKATGAVPQGESQQLWNSYHALLDQFYSQRSIYFELKELDRKKNLAAKQALCERAEALAKEQSINKALIELRHLHEEWKNVGPVPNEQSEPLWERFLQASEQVHERRKSFLTERNSKEEANLSSKLQLLEMVNSFTGYVTDRVNDWRSKTDELQKLKEQWSSIGLVPKEKAELINKQFWGTYKAFFQAKNAFFKALDDQKQENLKLKRDMCEYAESLQDNPNFEETKEKLIQLQKKWKTIGRVPDKDSDAIWNRFRNACNAFFDKRKADEQAQQEAAEKAAQERKTFTDQLEQNLIDKTEPASREGLQSLIEKWKGLPAAEGKAGSRMDERFYELTERYVDSIPDLTDSEKQEELFQLQMSRFTSSTDGDQQLRQREQQLRKEIQRLETDMGNLRTNMDFFAKSKNAEQIRKDYEQRLEESARKVQVLQRQLSQLRKTANK